MPHKKTPAVLAFDIGGTKIASAIVTREGKILDEKREPIRLENGPQGFLRQLSDIARSHFERHKARAIGIASAGPLDPVRGVLLDPTNFLTQGKGWKVVKLKQPLERSLKLPVRVENDAAAAALAEAWKGATRGIADSMVLTLGTGLGTGIIANGRLVRSGRYLHPEGGHITLHAGDETALCGCGNLGCSEAYLSGKHFAGRFNRLHGTDHTGEEITERARAGDAKALQAFREYGRFFAEAVCNYVVLFSPKRIAVTGSFAESIDLFLPHVHPALEKLLVRRRAGVDLYPEIVKSKLNNRGGIFGAARVAWEKNL